MRSNVSELSKKLLLGGLLYFRSCREQYLQAIKGSNATLLDPDEMTPYSMIERSMRLFIMADIEVSQPVLMQKLIADTRKLPKANMQLMASYVGIIDELDKQGQFTEQICSNVLKELAKTAVVRDTLEELKKLRTVAQTQEMLRAAADKLSTVDRPGKLVLYNPVQAAKEVLVHRDKVPTGITFLDYLLGGGIVWGEHGGCLGPPSGGKTLLANMILCNMAIQGHNVMLLQFEQSIKYNSDIMSRIYAYLTQLPRAEFADKSYNELSESAKTALQACENISSHILVGSFTDEKVERSVKSIIEAIDNAIESGFTPKLVIIDWLGAVVSEFLAAATGTDASYPILAQQIQDQLVTYGKSKNISFFFLHQSSNDASIKLPAYKPSMHDSYYFKGFSQKLEYCLELGTKSHQPGGKFACWLHCGKVRGAEPNKSVVVLLDGANAKMESTREGEYVVNSNGQFTSVAQTLLPGGEESRMPRVDPEAADAYLAGLGG